MNVSRFSLSAFCRKENGALWIAWFTCSMIFLDFSSAEALGQQGLGVIPAAFVGIGTGEGQLIELPDDLVAQDLRHGPEGGDLARELLDLVVVEVLEDFRGDALLEREDENRRLAQTADFV